MKRYTALLALFISIAGLEAKVITLRSETEFNQLAKPANGNVVVRVFATWCGPCRQTHPYFETVSNEFAGKVSFVEVNYDQFKKLADSLFVRSLPTWIYYKNGIEVLRHSGPVTVPALQNNVKQAFGL